ncbi:MAG: TetR/AcrR family transcriptional regulator [Eubacterium sp.]|nr:TetR/AcrR family transcriptional regulator [Eubacterium sp.]
MPPRTFTEEEREKLRISMLEQAIPLLEEYGLVHMSVDKITKKVGIGKSTFYNFFSSKEEYVSYALDHNRKKLLDELDEKFPPGKKMKPAEVFQMWFSTLLSDNSIYKNFSAEDERALYEADKARGKEVSLARETYIAERLMVHIEGVKKDLDIALLANYIKLIVLAYENSYMFHDSAMERMQNELKIRLIDLIFEEDVRAELIGMLRDDKQGNESE